MKLFISIILSVTISTCSDNTRFSGEWMMENEEGAEYMLQINSDLSGVFYSAEGLKMPLVIKDISKAQLTIDFGDNNEEEEQKKSGFKLLKSTEPSLRTYKYRFNEGKLVLTEIESNKEFVWCNCKEGCCNEEEFYYLKLGLSGMKLSIPEIHNDEIKRKKVSGEELRLFIGKPSKTWAGIYGNEYQVSDGENFLKDVHIALAIEKQARYDTEIERRTVLLFVDKSTPMQKLYELKRIFDMHYSVSKIQFALKRKGIKEDGFEFLKIKKVIDLSKEETKITFGEWINKD